ncbi:MAG: fliF [Verrucomicrobiales bacterium]|nr:fliF [Verrucomicrobiales bacterium]
MGGGQLNKQLQAIWKQLGLNQRISIVIAGLVVIAGLAVVSVWSTRTDYALLYGRLEDAESAKVIAALDDAKVPYRISRGGGTIMVPSDKVHLMRMQLAAKGVPRAGDGVGFEIFDKPNFGISDFVQRANYVRAIQGELARTISQVDLIEAARVMVVVPENRLLVDNNKKPTASVFVRTRGNSPLPLQTINAIRFLVANAVEGLQANFVTVIDNQGNVLSENNENDTMAGLTTTQLAARKNLEQYLAKKAEGMLEAVLGPGQAVVRVSAEINYDTLLRTEEKFDPDGQVVRISTVTDENTDSNNATQGGAPGITTDTTETNSVVTTPLNSSRMKKKVSNNQYELNKTHSESTQIAGGLKRVTAAVFVASRMTGSGTNRVAAPRTPEEVLKLRRIVQSALGIQEGTDAARKDEITLEEMPFSEQPIVEFAQQLQKQEKTTAWLETLKTALYPAIGLIVLFAFWRTFKKTTTDDIPIGIPLGELSSANGALNGSGKSKLKTGVVTVEVLNQLIRENPENMTDAIRTWMARGKN